MRVGPLLKPLAKISNMPGLTQASNVPYWPSGLLRTHRVCVLGV